MSQGIDKRPQQEIEKRLQQDPSTFAALGAPGDGFSWSPRSCAWILQRSQSPLQGFACPSGVPLAILETPRVGSGTLRSWYHLLDGTVQYAVWMNSSRWWPCPRDIDDARLHPLQVDKQCPGAIQIVRCCSAPDDTIGRSRQRLMFTRHPYAKLRSVFTHPSYCKPYCGVSLNASTMPLFKDWYHKRFSAGKYTKDNHLRSQNLQFFTPPGNKLLSHPSEYVVIPLEEFERDSARALAQLSARLRESYNYTKPLPMLGHSDNNHHSMANDQLLNLINSDAAFREEVVATFADDFRVFGYSPFHPAPMFRALDPPPDQMLARLTAELADYTSRLGDALRDGLGK